MAFVSDLTAYFVWSESGKEKCVRRSSGSHVRENSAICEKAIIVYDSISFYLFITISPRITRTDNDVSKCRDAHYLLLVFSSC